MNSPGRRTQRAASPSPHPQVSRDTCRPALRSAGKRPPRGPPGGRSASSSSRDAGSSKGTGCEARETAVPSAGSSPAEQRGCGRTQVRFACTFYFRSGLSSWHTDVFLRLEIKDPFYFFICIKLFSTIRISIYLTFLMLY
jgi:hypothetical protein